VISGWINGFMAHFLAHKVKNLGSLATVHFLRRENSCRAMGHLEGKMLVQL
jgi:hypothetical protein